MSFIEQPGDSARALVIGFSIHGLAVARALAADGVDVHALAQLTRRRSAPTYTRFATVHFGDGLNSERLVHHLNELVYRIPGNGRIVLFPTSDRMVATIANAWDQLPGRYAVSWSHCRGEILRLRRKDNLASIAEGADIRHPKSVTVAAKDMLEAGIPSITLPAIVKPAEPLSSFKAVIVRSWRELHALVERYPDELPFVVQDLIVGRDDSLYSWTSYLDRGRPIFDFTAQKIAAVPSGVGQGTVFLSRNIPDLSSLSRRFLRGLAISGPVAVEFKRDASGVFWMIEPNVGRTEYCVDLAIRCGFNIPMIEFRHALGHDANAEPRPGDSSGIAWFDTDKDPFCYIRSRRRMRRRQEPLREAVFPYWGYGDWTPIAMSVIEQLDRALRDALAAILRLVGRRPETDDFVAQR